MTLFLVPLLALGVVAAAVLALRLYGVFDGDLK